MSSSTQATLNRWTRRVAWLGVAACVPALLLGERVRRDPNFHPHFDWERWPGFFAGLSLLACLLLVALSKVWQWGVRRSEEYYGE
jgi:hypothetical protein